MGGALAGTLMGSGFRVKRGVVGGRSFFAHIFAILGLAREGLGAITLEACVCAVEQSTGCKEGFGLKLNSGITYLIGAFESRLYSVIDCHHA